MDFQARFLFLKTQNASCAPLHLSLETQSKTAWLCIVCSHQRLKPCVCGNCVGVHCTGRPPSPCLVSRFERCHIIPLLSFLGKVREHEALFQQKHCQALFFLDCDVFQKDTTEGQATCSAFCLLVSQENGSHPDSRDLFQLWHRSNWWLLMVLPGCSHEKRTSRSAIQWEWQLLLRAGSRSWEAFNSREHPIP